MYKSTFKKPARCKICDFYFKDNQPRKCIYQLCKKIFGQCLYYNPEGKALR